VLRFLRSCGASLGGKPRKCKQELFQFGIVGHMAEFSAITVYSLYNLLCHFGNDVNEINAKGTVRCCDRGVCKIGAGRFQNGTDSREDGAKAEISAVISR
jgi:hypothetical protein